MAFTGDNWNIWRIYVHFFYKQSYIWNILLFIVFICSMCWGSPPPTHKYGLLLLSFLKSNIHFCNIGFAILFFFFNFKFRFVIRDPENMELLIFLEIKLFIHHIGSAILFSKISSSDSDENLSPHLCPQASVCVKLHMAATKLTEQH